MAYLVMNKNLAISFEWLTLYPSKVIITKTPIYLKIPLVAGVLKR